MRWFNKITGKAKKGELSEEEKSSGEYEVKELQDNPQGKNPDAKEKGIKDINVNLKKEKEAEEDPTDLTENDLAIQDIKTIRLDLDAVHTKSVSHFGPRSEVSKCAFVAKAWLGKVLAQLGTKNPYPKANTVKTIPPTQEVADVNLYAFGLKDELEKINYLRDQLELSADEIDSLDFDDLKIGDKRLLAIARTQSYVNVCEARFALGNELAIIRNR